MHISARFAYRGYHPLGFIDMKHHKETKMDIKSYIGAVPNFPKGGVMFRDVSPLLHEPKALAHVVKEFAVAWAGKVDVIVALDARGFLFGSPLSLALQVPLVMVRKKGKLPGETISVAYALEYGEGVLEMQKGALKPGARVLVVDDLLATGGTVQGACALVESVGASVAGCAFVIELQGLGGRDKLSGKFVHSLVVYGADE